MSVLALLLLTVPAVCSDSHSLQYHFMGVSAPGFGLPEFSVVGYVDDHQATSYSSDTGRTVPVAPWMKENEGPENERPENWEQQTWSDKEDEDLFRLEVTLWKSRVNYTKGFHVLQVIQGCELRDDGSTSGYQHFRYDGRDYMFLDIQTGSFLPTMVEAQDVTQRWNSPDVRMGERCKIYLEGECITNLKRFTKLGREFLQRRVHPRVKVSGQEKGDAMKLHCQVYGFYPRAVDVKWMKNGEDEVPSYETTDVLPNLDGTYQIRVSAEVTPKEGDNYSCHVDHSSLEAPLSVRLEPEKRTVPALIITAGVIIIVILASVGIFLYKKKMKNCAAVRNEEDERRLGTPVTPDE